MKAQTICRTPNVSYIPSTNQNRTKMQERSVTKNELRVYYHIIRKTDGTDGQNSYVVNESLSILLPMKA